MRRTLAILLVLTLGLLVGARAAMPREEANTPPAATVASPTTADPAPPTAPLDPLATFEALGFDLVGVFETEGRTRALVSMTWGTETAERRDVLVELGDLLGGFTLRRIDPDRVVFGQAEKEYTLQMAGMRHIEPDLKMKVYSTAYAGPNAFHPRSDDFQANRIATDVRRQTIAQSNVRPPFIRPMSGWVSSPFGLRRRPVASKSQGGLYGSRMHQGVDIAAPVGSTVRAAADGRITESGYSWSKGHNISIQHTGGYTTHYFHLSRRYVSEGEFVKSGQRVGASGDTGISTGPHLHFEIRQGKQAIDPARFVPSLRKR